MKVKAYFKKENAFGFYGGERRYSGKEFTLNNPEDFSETWMVKVEDDKPKRGRKPKVEDDGEEGGE